MQLSVVGHLFGYLTRKKKDGIEVTYKKFRSKGKNAFEKRSGADGIIQIQVFSNYDNQLPIFSKGILFQAKTFSNSDRNRMQIQKRNMREFAGDKGAIITFHPTGEIFAYSGENELNEKSFDQFLAVDFLNCKEGVIGLRFDSTKSELYYPNSNTISNQSLEHILSITVN
ncbi:hypothetical protein LEP1GSC175_0155 [Leptospira santarosai str. HAI821]|uniref:hypothetical protein n=1 Tax=Leptospira santarosai TaxID=28183 RepID=UPI0002BFF069|nr:hypothetical protein [Leptospira santarosai]EMO13622.1 hypothetical protein LEP1GSC165_1649 [Leptospira santarosai str. CBC523]EMO31182.1 hypothetical protein LEP1GSC175_0155 [Leptospira santarosai str. HAI821]